MIGRWIVTLEHAATGALVPRAVRYRFVFRSWAISHCNWRNGRRRHLPTMRWVVVDRRLT